MSEDRTIYLIRHGETEWNRAKRLQGTKDSPLTKTGRYQAQAIAKCLEESPPRAMMTSPLGRAKATASIIAAHLGIEHAEDMRLSEMGFGAAEGLTLADIDLRWPGFRKRREQDKWHIRWPDGESYDDVDRRMASLIDHAMVPLCDKANVSAFALVAHETINIVLLGRLLFMDRSIVMRIGQPNDVVYRIRDRKVDHAKLDNNTLNWIPGLVQKDRGEILPFAA